MKSKLFGEFDATDENNKQFISDLKAVCELPPAHRQAIADALPGLLAASTEKQMQDRTDTLQRDTGASRLLIGHVCDFAGFFLRQMLDDRLKDEPFADWSSDLVELGLLEKQQEESFLALLQELKERTLPTVSRVRKELAYGVGVLPSLKSCGTTVELRAIFDKPYRWGISLKDYKPVLEKVVPVISVRISLDSGEISDIGFQMTPQLTDILIDHLKAARVDADLLSRRFLPSKEEQF